MRVDDSPSHSLRLHIDHLSPFAQVVWLLYCALFVQRTGARHCLEVDTSGLHQGSNAVLASGFLEKHFNSAVRLVKARREPDSHCDFALLSSSDQLSRKLVARFESIHVAPGGLPARVDAVVYWGEVAEPKFLRLLEETLRTYQSFDSCEGLAAIRRQFAPSRRKVTIATSVFNADEFLSGFLDNCANWHGYKGYEHFLVRANSPGNEHSALIEFVRCNPSAVYLNLTQDPGLYSVWNLVISLAAGEFVTSANLDDRRSPEQILKLRRVLREIRDADVISTPLRVSNEKNLPWEESKGLTTLFAGKRDPNGRYDSSRLIRQLPDGNYASRNLPHCMPLWRRELHGRFGFFREVEFGPSADWEFWLRCAVGGARFRFYPEPLGLYLKSPGSYWNVGSEGKNYDAEILRIYRKRCLDHQSDGNLPAQALRLARDELDQLAECHAWFDLFARLTSLACSEPLLSRAPNERRIIDEYALKHFGIEEFSAVVSIPAVGFDGRVPQANIVFECACYCLAEFRHNLANDHISRNWRGLCLDYCDVSGNDDGLVGVAYLHWVNAEHECAKRLLQEARMRSSRFWRIFQSLFRFAYSLDEVLTEFEADEDRSCPSGQAQERLNLWFYPDYTNNPYQALLYQPLKESGAEIHGIDRYASIDSMELRAGADNILHLHWINALFEGPARDRNFETVASEFINKIRTLKSRGVRVLWTVHNYLSHSAKDPTREWRFRQALAAQVDEVCIHHPMVADEIDWLPVSVKPRVVEHGSYDRPGHTRDSRQAARERLSIRPEESVIVCFGQIRAYKELERYLPVLLEWVGRNATARLFVLGEIHVPEVRHILSKAPADRVLVRDEYVGDDELGDYVYAADWGFLSYKAILTSGTLFYMLSRGLPALAPAKGTIPAYVIDGWNGYIYEQPSDLRATLERIGRLDSRVVSRMRDNALVLSNKLKWDLRINYTGDERGAGEL